MNSVRNLPLTLSPCLSRAGKKGLNVLGNYNSDDPRVIVEFEILMVGRPWPALH